MEIVRRSHARLAYTVSQARHTAAPHGSIAMNKMIRGGIAGFAAWKWGGGIIGTIVLFLIIYYLLGYL